MPASASRIFRTYAPCKVNVTLKAGGVEDGYHVISSIMQTVSHSYAISLRPVREGEEGVTGCETIHRILRRAVDELSRETGMKLPCRITTEYSLLLGAGLGVDSAHAAAVLRLLNEAFSLNLTVQQLHLVAGRVGNDVQFAVYGGRAQVDGGRLHTIIPMEVPDLHYVLAKPIGVSLQTPTQYRLLDETGRSLEQLAREACPVTDHLFNITTGRELEHGVTGKGPTVFWAYDNEDDSLWLQSIIRTMDNIAVWAPRSTKIYPITRGPLPPSG